MSIVGSFIVPHPPIILPGIGKGEEKKIQKTITAYRQIAGEAARMHPETVVIISPHSTMYRDYFHISPGSGAAGDFGQFGAAQVRVEAEYDTAFVEQLSLQVRKSGIPAGTEGKQSPELDHGTMIPLRFLQEAFSGFQIVRIGLSGLPLEEHFKLGQCITRTAEALDRRVVVIASGDLSHRLLKEGPYGLAKEGTVYDKRVTEVMSSAKLKDFLSFTEELCEKAGECGHRSFSVMAGCMEGITLSSHLLSYEGTFGVGYAVASFRDAYVELAVQSVDCYVKKGKPMELPEELPEEMLRRQAGVFVSLKEAGDLRGCIGTIQSTREYVAEEIMANAVSACACDPRFYPVEEKELKDIICTVDVLSEPEPIRSKEELDVKRYGVIVTKGRKRGLLLPNLEGVDTVGQQIEIALQKAGIEEEDYQMERFEVVRHY